MKASYSDGLVTCIFSYRGIMYGCKMVDLYHLLYPFSIPDITSGLKTYELSI